MLDPQLNRKARDVFEAALDLEPEQRTAYVEQECEGNDPLRQLVDRLLSADERTGEFLHEPAIFSPQALLGQRFGPYRLTDRIGIGGTSVVYRAERDDGELRQQVAVKLLRIGMESPDLKRRFAVERQILADLEHPYVARLLDGGTTPDDVPYVVMEYVRGTPIDRYCEDHSLSLHDRLRLFLKVCEAVQEAHRILVVHLDLKPANILVDERGLPRLLDFGIAKLLRAAGESAQTTTAGDRLLTPGYASPEQIAGGRITTASDVFSLGVVLGELLSGDRPFDWQGLTPVEIARRLESCEPRAPSDLVTQSATSDAPADHQRKARLLSRRLRGDLDTIVLKAVRVEPSQRYRSVDELAEDLRRYLAGLPVTARPAGVRYRLGKAVRRHPGAVLGLSGLFLGLVAVLVISLLYSSGLARERNRAESERLKAEQVVDLLLDSIESASPEGVASGDVTAGEIVEAAAERVGELADQPRVQAALKLAVGRVYHHIGRYDESRALLEDALAQTSELVDDDDEGLAASHLALASLYTDRGELDLAETHSRTALAMRRRLYGEAHPRLAESLWQLAQVHHEKGEYPRAKSLGLEALAMQRQLFGPESEAVATSLTTLARVVYYPDDYEEAERIARQAVDMNRRVMGPRHKKTAEALQALLHVMMHRGDFRLAEEHAVEVLSIFRERLSERHQLVAAAINDLAVVRYQLGEYGAAALLFRQALDLKRQQQGSEDHLATGLHNLAFVLRKQGDFDAAEGAYREALAIERRTRGNQHPFVAQTLRGLGDLARERGSYRESEKLYLEALAIDRQVFPDEDPNIANNLYDLGRLYIDARDYERAQDRLREALERQEATLGQRHPRTALTRKHLGILAHRRGALPEAERQLRAALEIQRETSPADSPVVAATLADLADVLCSLERFEEASELARQAVEIHDAQFPEGWQSATAKSVLGRAQAGLGDQLGARDLLQGSVALLERTVGSEAPMARAARRRLRDSRSDVRPDASFPSAEGSRSQTLRLRRSQ